MLRKLWGRPLDKRFFSPTIEGFIREKGVAIDAKTMEKAISY